MLSCEPTCGEGNIKMKFLEKILRLRVPDIEERIEKAVYQANNGGTMDDIYTIVDDFFFLIRKVYRRRKIKVAPYRGKDGNWCFI